MNQCHFGENVEVAETSYQNVRSFIILWSGEGVTSFTKGNRANWKTGRPRQRYAVAKISSCWVCAVSKRRIVQLGITFGSIFLLFPMKVAGTHGDSSRGKSSAPGSWWQPCPEEPLMRTSGSEVQGSSDSMNVFRYFIALRTQHRFLKYNKCRNTSNPNRY